MSTYQRQNKNTENFLDSNNCVSEYHQISIEIGRDDLSEDPHEMIEKAVRSSIEFGDHELDSHFEKWNRVLEEGYYIEELGFEAEDIFVTGQNKLYVIQIASATGKPDDQKGEFSFRQAEASAWMAENSVRYRGEVHTMALWPTEDIFEDKNRAEINREIEKRGRTEIDAYLIEIDPEIKEDLTLP